MKNIQSAKGTCTKNKKSGAGKTFDEIDLIIKVPVDAKAGQEIGLKMFVSGTPSPFKGRDGGDVYFVSGMLKGIREGGSKGMFTKVDTDHIFESGNSGTKKTVTKKVDTDDSPF